MIKQLKALFSPPPALAIAAVERDEARRQLLEAETQAEHYQHRVNFLRGVIQRLDGYLAPAPVDYNTTFVGTHSEV